MQNPEKDLIKAAQQGSVVAFEQLLRPVEKRMLSIVIGIVSSVDEAEDIYQEAMINALNALPRFRMESKFSTWLYRIVVNTAVNHRRRWKNKISRFITNNVLSQGFAEEQFEYYSSGKGPETELANKQLSQAINMALSSLSDNERVAFVLCHQQELKLAHAAQVMSCSDGAVKSYLFRAREKMRDQLQVYIG